MLEEKTIKATRRFRSVFRQFMNSNYYDLDDCYVKPSCYKQSAWCDCEDLRRQYHGSHMRVIGYSSHAFSVGFLAYENDEEYFIYITKDYTRVINTALL